MSRQEIVLENVIELGNTETVKSCVAGDLGIALLPRFAVEPQLADGHAAGGGQRFLTGAYHRRLLLPQE